MKPDVKQFVDKIFSINPTFSNAFGSGLPGMGATSVTASGGSVSASDVVNDLRKAATQFAEKANANVPKEELKLAGQKIEADLLNLRVLEQVSPELCDSLITELHDLYEK